MRRSSLSFFTALLASALLLPSCVRDVVLDAGENVQVAVECVMSNDSIQKLYLSFTKGASREEAEPLTEAVPTLIDLTESRTVGQFVKGEEENLWTLDYSAVPEHHYRLEVQVPGYELIWAEDIMPRRIKVTTVDPRKIAPGKYASQFKDHIYKFDEDFSSSLWIHGIDMEFEDWLVRTGPIAGEIFTDLQNVDNFNVTGEKYVPEIKLIVESYGKFTGIHTIYPDLKGAMKHDRFLRVNGGRCDELFLLSCNFSIWKDHAYYARPMIFMSVSDAYDDYLKTALMMDKVKESSDMSTLYLRDNLPSNIHGGIGIFGGKVQWDLDCGWRITYVPVEEYSKYGIDPETHKYIED